MPKVELHVHLEGATRADTLWTMATRNGVPLPGETPEAWEAFLTFRDFDQFVQAYYAATSTMRTLADWEFMIDRFLAQQAAENIVYSEVFISASHHLHRHDRDAFLETLGRAMQASSAKHGVRMALIPDISRESPETAEAVVGFVIAGHRAGVVLGLGIGGPEVGFPPEMYTASFKQARDAGLRVVAHAGETEGPASIRGALDALGAERIGHGIRVLEDDALTRACAASGVPFEVNPTSNRCTGVVGPDAPHPIHAMVESGLMVTVNSDDPALFNTTLTEEYQTLHREGMDLPTLIELNRNAMRSAFLDEPERRALLASLDAFLQSTESAATPTPTPLSPLHP